MGKQQYSFVALDVATATQTTVSSSSFDMSEANGLAISYGTEAGSTLTGAFQLYARVAVPSQDLTNVAQAGYVNITAVTFSALTGTTGAYAYLENVSDCRFTEAYVRYSAVSGIGSLYAMCAISED